MGGSSSKSSFQTVCWKQSEEELSSQTVEISYNDEKEITEGKNEKSQLNRLKILELYWKVLGVSVPLSIFLVPILNAKKEKTEEWILVDTGPEELFSFVKRAVNEETGNRGPSVVVLTHAHIDHAGNLIRCLDEWKDLKKVYMSFNEEKFLTKVGYKTLKGEATNPWFKRLASTLKDFSAEQRESFEKRLNDIDCLSFVRNGEYIENTLKVLELSGHTPGHIGLLHEEEKFFIAGDSFGYMSSMPFVKPSLQPAYFASTPNAEEAENTLKNSINELGKLEDRNMYRIFPSHDMGFKGFSWNCISHWMSKDV